MGVGVSLSPYPPTIVLMGLKIRLKIGYIYKYMGIIEINEVKQKALNYRGLNVLLTIDHTNS